MINEEEMPTSLFTYLSFSHRKESHAETKKEEKGKGVRGRFISTVSVGGFSFFQICGFVPFFKVAMTVPIETT